MSKKKELLKELFDYLDKIEELNEFAQQTLHELGGDFVKIVDTKNIAELYHKFSKEYDKEDKK